MDTGSITVADLLQQSREQLAAISDSPRLDAEVLLAHSLSQSRTWLMTWPDKALDASQLAAFTTLLQRRLQGEPVAHILGQREFWSLPLKVTPDTLIPRPETELMIETLLELYPAQPPRSLLDLGTGTGAIALAMASERPDWQITATDQSTTALAVARHNAEQLGLEAEFLAGSWFAPLGSRRFDIIASNPPYIPQHDPHLMRGDVRFEPISALAAGHDGLDDIRTICEQAPQHLMTGGRLIIEHGYDQKTAVYEVFAQNGFENLLQIDDLAGQPRLTTGIFP